jgi:3-hydroxybutyryl-CoA dehydrogenase
MNIEQMNIAGLNVPERVGVLGGGRMGAGIAHAFLLAGADVVVVERSADDADAARARIEKAIDASIERGTTSRLTTSVTRSQLTAMLTVGDESRLFADRELVVEAVPEDRALKLEALSMVEQQVSAEAAIATNTSSISITALAAGLQLPERFIGLHFFNPVPASALVEIVVGEATSAGLVEAAQGWVTAIGKTPVTVQDAPGFASSRLGVALGLEAIRMLEDGVASAEDIDAAMVLGYKHPIGPLRLTDIVGLDVRLAIADYLRGELGPRFEPPSLLRTMVADGKLGRKAGQGFYTWDER